MIALVRGPVFFENFNFPGTYFFIYDEIRTEQY